MQTSFASEATELRSPITQLFDSNEEASSRYCNFAYFALACFRMEMSGCSPLADFRNLADSK